MKIRVENYEVWNAWKETQRLTHDVNRDRRMQRSKGRIFLHFVDQVGRDALVVLHGRASRGHAMADGKRGREVARMQRVCYKCKSHCACRQGRRLVDELLAFSILDPEFAEIGADAVYRAFVKLGALAIGRFIDSKLDRRRTAVQNQNWQRRHAYETPQ